MEPALHGSGSSQVTAIGIRGHFYNDLQTMDKHFSNVKRIAETRDYDLLGAELDSWLNATQKIAKQRPNEKKNLAELAFRIRRLKNDWDSALLCDDEIDSFVNSYDRIIEGWKKQVQSRET